MQTRTAPAAGVFDGQPLKRMLLATSAALAALALASTSAPAPAQQGQAQQGQSGQGSFHRPETQGRPAVPNSDVDYTKSMERLFQAAQRLREAVQAMAQQPPGEHRNRAMDTAREALLETQQAMAQTAAANQATSGSGSGSSSSGASASGSGASGPSGSSGGGGSNRSGASTGGSSGSNR